MSELIDPDDDPIERCSALCSEVLFELRRDVFAVKSSNSQVQDSTSKTTVSLRSRTRSLRLSY